MKGKKATGNYSFKPNEEQRRQMAIDGFLIDEGLAPLRVWDGVDANGQHKYKTLKEAKPRGGE